MNYVAEEILSNLNSGKDLVHYGTKYHSGRFPYGSGENPYQHDNRFLARIEKLKAEGFTNEKDLAKALGMSTTEYRRQYSIAKNQYRSDLVTWAESLKAQGYSLREIAKEMGLDNDSSVRSLLNEKAKARMNAAMGTADFLRAQVAEKGMIDVGVGVEKLRDLNISRQKFEEALTILKNEGYEVYGGRVEQLTNPGRFTTIQVLCPPDTPHKEIFNYDEVKSIEDYTTRDGGKTFSSYKYPESMDSSRLQIVYGDKGGSEKDGLIEIRRNVEDLSLGESRYAQVRILVDGTHYIKGMAVYSDDLPDGKDVRFNTNKGSDKSLEQVLKPIKDDESNPFGTAIKANGQSEYLGADGKPHLSLINKCNEEGDWVQWKDKLPSQFLGKQPDSLIKQQLSMELDSKQSEFDEISSLTNPTLKKHLLETFANDCDSSAVYLQAAALPRQQYHVILPVPELKDTEVYAPNYKNGEQVALIRYPHGGTFEIPILTVNNKNQDAQKLFKDADGNVKNDASDAICISPNVAKRLSGADFDGDTVMVIPTNDKVRITSTPALEGLKGFDPSVEYGGKPEGTFQIMRNTQTAMGVISNLVTDMTLKGATRDELARAVRHSMVVIDAEKHKLDYQQSFIDNNIAELRDKYQGHYDEDGTFTSGGASTLLSRAKSETRIDKRQGSPKIDPDTGKLVYKTDPKTYIDAKGNEVHRKQLSTQMMDTDDAYTLSSGTKKESYYADYANALKAMANDARKMILATGKIEYSKAANNQYQNEVNSLLDKLNESLKNAPRERQAQLIATSRAKAKLEAHPLPKSEAKKLKQRELTRARDQVGAKRTLIEITPNEWKAIQSGAISEHRLKLILNHTDLDLLRSYATPKTSSGLSGAKLSQLKAMNARGYTNEEIAERLGISTSSVSKYLKM